MKVSKLAPVTRSTAVVRSVAMTGRVYTVVYPGMYSRVYTRRVPPTYPGGAYIPGYTLSPYPGGSSGHDSLLFSPKEGDLSSGHDSLFHTQGDLSSGHDSLICYTRGETYGRDTPERYTQGGIPGYIPTYKHPGRHTRVYTPLYTVREASWAIYTVIHR